MGRGYSTIRYKKTKKTKVTDKGEVSTLTLCSGAHVNTKPVVH